jgi:hypothetical protein
MEKQIVIRRLICSHDPHHSHNSEEILQKALEARKNRKELPCQVTGCRGKLRIKEY